MALIEAMGHGVVPLTTPQGGIPDLFEPDGIGALCSPRHLDPIALADAIEAFAREPERFRLASRSVLARQRSELTASVAYAAVLRVLQA
jgi:glycosyltransferase involved in cell wall biosynthesis